MSRAGVGGRRTGWDCTPRLFSQRENEQRGKGRKERREKARRAFPVRIPLGRRGPGLSDVSSLAAFPGVEGGRRRTWWRRSLGSGAERAGTHLFSSRPRLREPQSPYLLHPTLSVREPRGPCGSAPACIGSGVEESMGAG